MPVAQRTTLLRSIASTIADYRLGEIPPPNETHVDRWVHQFDSAVQLPLLTELDHVLKSTYLSRYTVESILTRLCTNAELAGTDPAAFWRGVNFLDIQRGGASQSEMLVMFTQLLKKACGVTVKKNSVTAGPYVYLDDGVFTGNRVLNDIRGWVALAPVQCVLHVIVIAYHTGGQWYAKNQIEKAFVQAGKTVKQHWWRVVALEDRKSAIATSDVLRPTVLPADVAVHGYATSLAYPPILRAGESLGANSVFASAAGRHLLEQEFLKAGVRIRQQSPLLGPYQRPLGNMVLDTLGFGTTVVTFRNCPNNCPLAFWAGSPWYPLFPRKMN